MLQSMGSQRVGHERVTEQQQELGGQGRGGGPPTGKSQQMALIPRPLPLQSTRGDHHVVLEPHPLPARMTPTVSLLYPLTRLLYTWSSCARPEDEAEAQRGQTGLAHRGGLDGGSPGVPHQGPVCTLQTPQWRPRVGRAAAILGRLDCLPLLALSRSPSTLTV